MTLPLKILTPPGKGSNSTPQGGPLVIFASSRSRTTVKWAWAAPSGESREGVDVKFWINRRIKYQTTTTCLPQVILIWTLLALPIERLYCALFTASNVKVLLGFHDVPITHYIICEEKFRFLLLATRVLSDQKWMWNVCCLP